MATSVPPGTPPLLYLPCSSSGPDGPPEVLRRTTARRRAALVGYTALDRLHAACGAGHPWALLSLAQLQQLHAADPYDELFLDLVMPAELQVAGTRDETPALPPVLYVPCRSHAAHLDDALVEYVRGQDGLVSLPVYTSLDRLHAGTGPGQPWVVVETSRLEALHDRAPYDRLLVDESLTITATEEARR